MRLSALVMIALLPLATACGGGGGEGGLMAAPGWEVGVIESGLGTVDNLAIAPDGSIFASIESGNRVVHLANGGRSVVTDAVNHPDGLCFCVGELFVAEEIQNGRVLRVRTADGTVESLVELTRPEGLEEEPGGMLVVSEDVSPGRVLRIDPANGHLLAVLAEGLDRPEGLAVGAGGEIYVAETGTGRVLVLSGGSHQTLVEGLREPDQLALSSDGSVWITEDADPGRLLRYFGGALATIVDGLASPQGIALRGSDVLVAEQARGRILSVRPAA